jgi:DNA excision repair protein ERCC-3
MLLMDEVHVVPAKMFSMVTKMVSAHTKLGLTATLVREDDLIEDLNFLVGPKLYEANWMDLQQAGHLAAVQCNEVWCPMTPEFFSEYLSCSSGAKQKMLFWLNPNKFRACEFLVRYHERQRDKIIIFSDSIFALRMYAQKLGAPFIDSKCSDEEKEVYLQRFRRDPKCRTILLSRVGDTSIDLPDANVIIQVSSHFGARRQEAQRLGRILRPKTHNDTSDFNAFFYSLVSCDTKEMLFSAKRQQFLVDQGYAFRVITGLEELFPPNLQLSSKESQLQLLAQIRAADDREAEDEELPDDVDDIDKANAQVSVARRTGRMATLSGGGDMMYMEFSGAIEAGVTGRGQTTKQRLNRHPLFSRRYRGVASNK